MRGMSATTGRAIEGAEHLVQSVNDVLTTPLNTRVMRRDYGSLMPELIDQPFTGQTRTLLYGAVATALMRWEPRIRISKLSISQGDAPGAFVLDVEGTRTDVTQGSGYTRLTIPLRFR
ncbi:TPA: GPW/gp25 family protein [Stenotrophomonas maltophilia]|nr:GPW/gp25 family protein [Stenotrophomonas maltophilia]